MGVAQIRLSGRGGKEGALYCKLRRSALPRSRPMACQKTFKDHESLSTGRVEADTTKWVHRGCVSSLSLEEEDSSSGTGTDSRRGGEAGENVRREGLNLSYR